MKTRIITFLFGLAAADLVAQPAPESTLADAPVQVEVDNSHFSLTIQTVEKKKQNQVSKATGPYLLQLHGYSLYETLEHLFAGAGVYAKIENLSRNPKLAVDYQSKENRPLSANLDEILAVFAREFGFTVSRKVLPLTWYEIKIADPAGTRPIPDDKDPGIVSMVQYNGSTLKYKGTLKNFAKELEKKMGLLVIVPEEIAGQRYEIEVNTSSAAALGESLLPNGMTLAEQQKEALHYLIR